jgi:hypothetical protein
MPTVKPQPKAGRPTAVRRAAAPQPRKQKNKKPAGFFFGQNVNLLLKPYGLF